jgi:hypothetical protein
MPELPLEQVEELVEESVFHPSPCKRHREQVLKSAVQATVRQKVSHRMIAFGSASVLVLGMGILLIRAVATSRPAVPENAPTASAASVEATAAVPATPTAAPQHPGSSGSLGEELYRSSESADGAAGRRSGP